MTNAARKQLARWRLLIHCAGVVITAAVWAGGFFGYHLLESRTTKLQRQFDATSRFERMGDALFAKNRQMQGQLAEMKALATTVMARIPESRNESELLAQLSKLAKQNQLSIQNYRPGHELPRKRHTEMDIELSAEGGYKSLCRFLDGLRELPRLCRIVNFKITAPDQPGPYPIEMTLRIYYSPLPNVVAVKD